MGDWRKDAACLDADPEVFYPPETSRVEAYAEAMAFCARCAVSKECLADAWETEVSESQTFGMRGGLLPGMRTSLRRRLTRRAAKVGAS